MGWPDGRAGGAGKCRVPEEGPRAALGRQGPSAQLTPDGGPLEQKLQLPLGQECLISIKVGAPVVRRGSPIRPGTLRGPGAISSLRLGAQTRASWGSVSVPPSLAPLPCPGEGPGAGGSARQPWDVGRGLAPSQPPQSRAQSVQRRARGRTSKSLAFCSTVYCPLPRQCWPAARFRREALLQGKKLLSGVRGGYLPAPACIQLS